MAQHFALDSLAAADRHALTGPTGQHALGARFEFILVCHRGTPAEIALQSWRIVDARPLGNL
jgi:hypothetical protein